VEVVASLRGIDRSDELPLHSPGAEIVPDGSGSVMMRVDPDLSETRPRPNAIWTLGRLQANTTSRPFSFGPMRSNGRGRGE